MVTSVTNCPVADVPDPPAVIAIAPAELMVPAKDPAVPGAVETVLLYPFTSPTSAAVVTMLSPILIDCVKLYAFPWVVCATSGRANVAAPAALTADMPPRLLAALPPDGVIVVETPDPLVLYVFAALET